MDNIIKLPEPETTGGMPVNEAFAMRRSSREFSGRGFDISTETGLQELSNLLWAGFGRCRGNRRTAPSSHNRQETDLFVFLKEGVYLYDADGNSLILKDERDLRSATGEQDFVGDAPVNVALVSDTTKIKGKTHQGIIEAIYANAGFICENFYLHCASAGLGTVARAMVDKPALASLLALPETSVITLVQTVGY